MTAFAVGQQVKWYSARQLPNLLPGNLSFAAYFGVVTKLGQTLIRVQLYQHRADRNPRDKWVRPSELELFEWQDNEAGAAPKGET